MKPVSPPRNLPLAHTDFIALATAVKNTATIPTG
jgi:hypothetical protein